MLEPTSLSALATTLNLGSHEHVAIVGGGGKTTVLHALGDQLTGSVVLTCTTKMGHDQHRGRPVLLDPSAEDLVATVAREPVMVWKRIDGQKAVGVAPDRCDDWFSLVDHVVIEADGSRRRPFKAPADYEPVVPATSTMMISVIGADALGRVIADQCHRPLRVAALAGCSAYERLSPPAAAAVLTHERGALKERPPQARFAIVVTKVDGSTRSMVDELVGAVEVRRPGTGIVLLPAVAEPAEGA